MRPPAQEMDIAQAFEPRNVDQHLADQDQRPLGVPRRQVFDQVEIDPVLNGSIEADDRLGDRPQVLRHRRFIRKRRTEQVVVHAMTGQIRPRVQLLARIDQRLRRSEDDAGPADQLPLRRRRFLPVNVSELRPLVGAVINRQAFA